MQAKLNILLMIALCFIAMPMHSPRAQIFPPGTFAIDGIPVHCGPVTTVLQPNLPDVGMADGRGNIFLNPLVLNNLPTVLKLYWFAHECGHYNVGPDEVSADCWAVKTGRNQRWFSPQDFQWLMMMFQNNPGDMAHPSGLQRVQMMWQCYNSP